MTTRPILDGSQKPGPEIGKRTNWEACPTKNEQVFFRLMKNTRPRSFRDSYSSDVLRLVGIKPYILRNQGDVETVRNEYSKRKDLADSICDRIEQMRQEDPNYEKLDLIVINDRQYTLPTMAHLGMLEEAEGTDDMWLVSVEGRNPELVTWEDLLEGFDENIIAEHMQESIHKVYPYPASYIKANRYFREKYCVEIPISETP